MARRTRATTDRLEGPNEIPTAVDPTGIFEAFIRRLERVSDGNTARGQQAPTRDKLLKEFCGLHPSKFDGLSEPWQAEQWLRDMENIFEAMECSDIEKRRLATFQLTFVAAEWWEAEKATLGTESTRRMPWMTFKERFLAKFFPGTEMDKKEQEFLNLVQGDKPVREYTIQFDRLSRFAQHLVDTPQKKIKKYHRGLNTFLRRLTRGHLDQSFEALVELATGLEEDGCQAQKPSETQAIPKVNCAQISLHGTKKTWNERKRPRPADPQG